MTTRRLAAFATGKPADGLRADGAPGLHDSLPAPCVAVRRYIRDQKTSRKSSEKAPTTSAE